MKVGSVILAVCAIWTEEKEAGVSSHAECILCAINKPLRFTKG